jgi:hypothetical protein
LERLKALDKTDWTFQFGIVCYKEWKCNDM